MTVDRPDEFESFVLLEVFDDDESLDLLLFEGEGGGRWRGKGEPGQIITHSHFSLSLLTVRKGLFGLSLVSLSYAYHSVLRPTKSSP